MGSRSRPLTRVQVNSSMDAADHTAKASEDVSRLGEVVEVCVSAMYGN